MVGRVQVDKEEFELRVRLCCGCLPAAVPPLRLQLAVLRCEAALEGLSSCLWLHVMRTPHQRLQRPCNNDTPQLSLLEASLKLREKACVKTVVSALRPT